MVDADLRRRMGESIEIHQERIGKLVLEVKQLQLMDTPATKADIEHVAKLSADLAEQFRKEIVAIERRAKVQRERLAELTELLHKSDREVGQIKAIAARTRVFAAISAFVAGVAIAVPYLH